MVAMKMFEPKFSPCPFCGGKAELIVERQLSYADEYILRANCYIRCRKCGCKTPTEENRFMMDEDGDVIKLSDGVEKVAKAWEQRCKKK